MDPTNTDDDFFSTRGSLTSLPETIPAAVAPPSTIATKDDDEDDDEEEKLDVPEDIYSMIYLAPWTSYPFWYSVGIFLVQIAILGLAISNLRGGASNPANIPATGNYEVYAAQFLALIISVMSQEDTTTSLFFISIGLGDDYPKVEELLKQKYPDGAKMWQYWLGNGLRLAEGNITIATSFFFIVQAETVLDIFQDFAGIQFVSELDNLGFRIAKEGWFGRGLQKFARKIAKEEIPFKKHKGCIDYFNQSFLFIIIAALLAGFSVVVYLQEHGYYVEVDACSVVDVRFGGEVYAFPTTASLKTHEGTIYLENSSRYISPYRDPNDPPDLHYAFFSGKYKADFKNKAGIQGQRPVYYEASKDPAGAPDLPHDDPSLGFFYYCEREKAWVWSVRSFLDAGVIPQKTVDHCKYGWLLRSPTTDAVTLEDAPRVGWSVWTGVLDTSSDLSFSCLECNKDMDCGLDQGICGDDKVCHCNDGIGGDFCNKDQTCTGLVGLYNGTEVGPFSTQNWFQYDGRPQFFSSWMLNSTSSPTVLEEHWVWIQYAGRRWTVQFGPIARFIAVERDTKNDDHAYWYRSFLDLPYQYSEPTEKFLPTGPLKWYIIDETRSEGDYGPMGREVQVFFKFSCLSVDCDRSNRICGRYGKCVKEQVLTVDGAVAYNTIPTGGPDELLIVNGTYAFDWGEEGPPAFVGGKCICDEGYYGYFCEFKNETQLDDEL